MNADALDKTKAKEPVPKGSWLAFLGIWLITCSAPLNMFKPATIAPELMEALAIPATSYGWIMSVFSICGLILAIPAAGLVRKLGLKKIFLICSGSVILGGLIGALSTGFEMLIVSRIIEGAGMGFVAVATPTAIALLFPEGRRALPIGLYQTWMPIGTVLSMNLGPILANAFGWRGIWWFAIAFSVIACVVFLVTWKEPKAALADDGTEVKVVPGNLGSAFKNPLIWVLSIGMFVFAFTCTGTTSSFWSLFMRTEAGIDPQSAAFITSLCTALGILGTPLCGTISDKLGRIKPTLMIGWAVVFVFLVFAFNTYDYAILLVLGIMNGLFQGWVPTMLTTATAQVATVDELPMSMGIFNVFRNLGNIIGGSALAYLVTPMGWAMGSWVLCLPLVAIAVILILVTTRKAFK